MFSRVLTKNDIQALSSHVKLIIRPMYSNPPRHGAEIVAKVLSTPSLFAKWKEEIKIMSGRIITMRKALRDELVKLETPGNWDHIVSQIGMFSFTGVVYVTNAPPPLLFCLSLSPTSLQGSRVSSVNS